MATKGRMIELEFVKCRPTCEDCFELKDRHYPFDGTSGKYPALQMYRLDILVGPQSPMHRWENLEHLRRPEGYKYFTNYHHGAESWARYQWWTARIPRLAQGDVVQELYEQSRAADGLARRTFVVVEDRVNALELLRVRGVPTNPHLLLRKDAE